MLQEEKENSENMDVIDDIKDSDEIKDIKKDDGTYNLHQISYNLISPVNDAFFAANINQAPIEPKRISYYPSLSAYIPLQDLLEKHYLRKII